MSREYMGRTSDTVRGSGLFVGETGLAANHHFVAPMDSGFHFTEGRYKLDVFARLLGDAKPLQLFSQVLDITREIAASLQEPGAGVYFDRGPDSLRYLPHVEGPECNEGGMPTAHTPTLLSPVDP